MSDLSINSIDSGMIVLVVVLPLLAAFLLPMISRVSLWAARALGPLVLLSGLVISAGIWLQQPDTVMIALGGFSPPAGVVFYIDQLSLLFTMLVMMVSLMLWSYDRKSSVQEHTLTLLLVAAAAGMALSGDLFNIYVFYELASVASFGLIASAATGAAYAAAIRYLIISGFGTVLALTGIGVIYTLTGTLNIAQLAQLAPEHLHTTSGVVAFLLILFGIGVKAELFPVNTWVPEVYSVAHKRVTALLAGLLSKLAVLVLVRLLVLVFQTEQAMMMILALGTLGLLSGELAAWRCRDMKRLLAFSSIGQLGLVFIAFSIPGEAGMYAGLAIALHHLLVKPALFLLIDHWPGDLSALAGSAKRSPMAALLFVLFVLSLIGVPPLPGFWAKLLLLTGLSSQSEAAYHVAVLVILIATVVEANYFFRVTIGLYAKADTSAQSLNAELTIGSRLDFAISSIFAAALIAAVVFITPLAGVLKQTASQATDVQVYVATVFPVSSKKQ